jgi:hypothetical protein
MNSNGFIIINKSGLKTTPEADKPQVRLNSKASGGLKAESANALWRMNIHLVAGSHSHPFLNTMAFN